MINNRSKNAIWDKLKHNPREGALRLSAEGEVVEADDVFAQLVGRALSSLEGASFLEMISRRFQRRVEKALRELSSGKAETELLEIGFDKSDGAEFPAEVFAISILSESGNPPEIWCFVRKTEPIPREQLEFACDRKRCIYEIADLAMAADTTEMDIFDSIVENLPALFHCPEDVYFKISYKFNQFESGLVENAQSHFKYDILEYGNKVGEIEVAVDEECERPLIDEHEAVFIEALAGWIGKLGEIKSLREKASHIAEIEKKRSTELHLANEELRTIQRSMLNLMDDLKREIEERKAAEEKLDRANIELKEKNRELEQIIFVASHDMRTPLVTIAGFSHEIALALKSIISHLESEDIDLGENASEIKFLIDEDILSSLKFMSSGVDRIQLMLDALLVYSRTGRQELNLELVDMTEIVRKILDSAMFHIGETGLSFDLETLPPCVADKAKITQVFSNLIENSIKFQKPEKQGHIWISGKKKGKRVVYCVRDDGIGIPKDKIEDIFLLFYKIDTNSGNGEGLGLSVVKKIVEKHAGKVWVESTLGEGCAFYIELPASYER